MDTPYSETANRRDADARPTGIISRQLPMSSLQIKFEKRYRTELQLNSTEPVKPASIYYMNQPHNSHYAHNRHDETMHNAVRLLP